eukprot:scaffold10022_cov156-Skeletonema_marinoi.AAC.18
MGRKRNQGKARKAAKAKAREEAEKTMTSGQEQPLGAGEAAEEERGHNNNDLMTNGQLQSLAAQIQQLQDTTITCDHGFEETDIKVRAICSKFVTAFKDAFYDVIEDGGGGAEISICLLGATKATTGEFAEVWNDSTKMDFVISFLLSHGTQYVLEENHNYARHGAIFARFFEQYAAVQFKQTQAIINWSKIFVLNPEVDEHTLVKLFWKRIPCKCLDKIYEQVKSVTKMGFCCNPQCSYEVERSNTMYCSRCRCATYCSRECQEVDWSRHKKSCNEDAAERAEFEAKKQHLHSDS